jgi:hypothetical protein
MCFKGLEGEGGLEDADQRAQGGRVYVGGSGVYVVTGGMVRVCERGPSSIPLAASAQFNHCIAGF